MNRRHQIRNGFTMLEMLVAVCIFLIICAAMFELLNLSQQKYSSETQLTAVYQDARLAMDQIIRDVNASGYPSAKLFSPVPTAYPSRYAINSVAWSPNYPTTPCQLGASCATPGDYDLIVETRLSTDTSVSWIWYHLAGTTLYRTVVPKTSGDPQSIVTSSGQQVAFLSNVMNNPGSAQLAQITSQYPSMFPGTQPQPVFQYSCETPTGPMPCSTAGPYNSANNISDVDITLIVKTPQPDRQTQRLKLVELNGRGHGSNSLQ
jgi:prepilin-type N-terminal cleavage/methylation domain-containing protein